MYLNRALWNYLVHCLMIAATSEMFALITGKFAGVSAAVGEDELITYLGSCHHKYARGRLHRIEASDINEDIEGSMPE